MVSYSISYLLVLQIASLSNNNELMEKCLCVLASDMAAVDEQYQRQSMLNRE